MTPEIWRTILDYLLRLVHLVTTTACLSGRHLLYSEGRGRDVAFLTTSKSCTEQALECYSCSTGRIKIVDEDRAALDFFARIQRLPVTIFQILRDTRLELPYCAALVTHPITAIQSWVNAPKRSRTVTVWTRWRYTYHHVTNSYLGWERHR